MTKRHKPAAPRERTTQALTGTIYRSPQHLDATSLAAGRYACLWLKRAGSKSMPLSGVVRRALQLYAQHLNRPDTDPAHEVRMAAQACAVIAMDSSTREAITGRLEAVPSSQPMPSWSDVLNGPGHAERWAKFNAETEALVEQLQKRRNSKPTPTRTPSPKDDTQ